MSPKDTRSPTRAIVEAQIDENLRRIFEEDVDSELPDRLRSLVERLGELDPRDPTGARDKHENDTERSD